MIYIKKLALILTIIGALNWGLIGLINFNLVSFLFGPMSLISRLIYILVGASSLLLIGEVPCQVIKEKLITKK